MHTVEAEIGGRTLTLESGKLAAQADGAVTVRYGDSVILATVVMSDQVREGIDFFPLSVDFEERAYSIGKIPGSVFRREGRPPLSGILASRLTDRPLRPLFPDGMRNEVQIILLLLAHDGSSPIDVLGTIGASAALAISGIPFDGPVGAVRVGLKDGEFELNPVSETLGERPELDLIVTGTRDGVVMLEAGADELPDQRMVEAIMWGQDQLQATIDLQERLRELTSKPAREPVILQVDQALIDTYR